MQRTKLTCFSNSKNSIPIITHTKNSFKKSKAKLNNSQQQWLLVNGFIGAVEQVCIMPDNKGNIKEVFFGIDEDNNYSLASIVKKLPKGNYHFANDNANASLMWGLESYKYNKSVKLFATNQITEIKNIVSAIYWIRDLINMPANLLGPNKLAAEASQLQQYGADVSVLSGVDLDNEYPAVAAVGNGSSRKPCLIDLNWGESHHPAVTLVGKGVCFDSGGLNIKPTSGMRQMKKDMAGAAHVLGLAKLIMQFKLPIKLRVLIPAVENSISGESYRPGDVINTKAGINIEIDNTDAEGRVALCESIYDAAMANPSLIISMATLTGAASIGLAPDLPSMFCDNQEIVELLKKHSKQTQDKLWHMPYHEEYKQSLYSNEGNLLNATSGNPYGGAIKAAMFLREFVKSKTTNFMHIDFMAWNLANRPGRPMGGEAMTIRALLSFLTEFAASEVK